MQCSILFVETEHPGVSLGHFFQVIILKSWLEIIQYLEFTHFYANNWIDAGILEFDL